MDSFGQGILLVFKTLIDEIDGFRDGHPFFNHHYLLLMIKQQAHTPTPPHAIFHLSDLSHPEVGMGDA